MLAGRAGRVPRDEAEDLWWRWAARQDANAIECWRQTERGHLGRRGCHAQSIQACKVIERRGERGEGF